MVKNHDGRDAKIHTENCTRVSVLGSFQASHVEKLSALGVTAKPCPQLLRILRRASP